MTHNQRDIFHPYLVRPRSVPPHWRPFAECEVVSGSNHDQQWKPFHVDLRPVSAQHSKMGANPYLTKRLEANQHDSSSYQNCRIIQSNDLIEYAVREYSKCNGTLPRLLNGYRSIQFRNLSGSVEPLSLEKRIHLHE